MIREVVLADLVAAGTGGGGPRGPLFGGGGGPPSMSSNSDRRYNLTLGVSARNLFNNVNVTNPSGVLGSKFFGVSNNIQGFPFSPGNHRQSPHRLDRDLQLLSERHSCRHIAT